MEAGNDGFFYDIFQHSIARRNGKDKAHSDDELSDIPDFQMIKLIPDRLLSH